MFVYVSLKKIKQVFHKDVSAGRGFVKIGDEASGGRLWIAKVTRILGGYNELLKIRNQSRSLPCCNSVRLTQIW